MSKKKAIIIIYKLNVIMVFLSSCKHIHPIQFIIHQPACRSTLYVILAAGIEKGREINQE